MTEQERQDLITTLKASEPPVALKEVRQELRERRSRMLSEITPHKASNGVSYDLDKVTHINGKDVKEWDKNAKREGIWSEMAAINDLAEVERAESGIWNEARRMARLKLAGLPKNEIELRTSGDPSFGIDPAIMRDAQAEKVVEAAKGLIGSTEKYADVKDLDLKAMTGTGGGASTIGWKPESVESGHIQWMGYQKPSLKALFPQTSTEQELIRYREETPVAPADYDKNVEGANSANQQKVRTIAEGRAYDEMDVRFIVRQASVSKIGVYISVTEEELEDVPRMRTILPMKIRQALARREDYFAIHGEAPVVAVDQTERPGFPGLDRLVSDSGQHASGTNKLSSGGASTIQTLAMTDEDNVPNLIHRAFTDIEVNAFCMAGPVAMHPNGWHRLATLQTADGAYIWAHPSTMATPSIWAHPIVTNTNVTDGTAWTGDFAEQSEWCTRIGAQVAWGMVKNNFLEDVRVLKIRTRAAMIIYRPSAFVKMTGLPTT